MTDDLEELFENHFHGAALWAFVEQAALQNDWPCPHATRQRAYKIYEADLRIRRGNG